MPQPEKSIFFAGNWKDKKETTADATAWVAQFQALMTDEVQKRLGTVGMVVCVPFSLLSTVAQLINSAKLPLFAGAQDVSQFAAGDKPVTGEVTARMLKDAGASWVIIGHSERRQKLGETDEVLSRKVERAKSEGLQVIFCVPDAQTAVPAGIEVVAYEPVWAIGSGKAEDPLAANKVTAEIEVLHRRRKRN